MSSWKFREWRRRNRVMLKVGVLVSGGGTNLQALMDSIKGSEQVEIVSVVSNRKNAYAFQRAKEKRIHTEWISPKIYDSPAAFNIALRDHFKARGVELIVMAGYLVIVGKELIQAYPRSIINIHPSLIPAFCGDGFYGLKVHEAVLEKGVQVTGATVHYVDEGTDTGPIIKQKAVMVKKGDTPEMLQQRVMKEAEWVILPQVVKEIAAEKANNHREVST